MILVPRKSKHFATIEKPANFVLLSILSVVNPVQPQCASICTLESWGYNKGCSRYFLCWSVMAVIGSKTQNDSYEIQKKCYIVLTRGTTVKYSFP